LKARKKKRKLKAKQKEKPIMEFGGQKKRENIKPKMK
jgi:hypothetical protein